MTVAYSNLLVAGPHGFPPARERRENEKALWLWQRSVSGGLDRYRYLGPGIPPEVTREGWRFSEFPPHFLSFQTAGLPRSVGQGLEFRKPGHLRTFPDICLNQDLPDVGIFTMRPNHAARATTRVAPTSHPCPGHGGGAKSSLPGAGGTPALQFCRPVLVTPSELYERRGVMPHRYYGRGLLSDMTRGGCQ